MSNEKQPGCLGYIGDYTTQFSGDYNKLVYRSHTTQLYHDNNEPWHKDPYQTTRIHWKVRPFFLFRGSNVHLHPICSHLRWPATTAQIWFLPWTSSWVPWTVASTGSYRVMHNYFYLIYYVSVYVVYIDIFVFWVYVIYIYIFLFFLGIFDIYIYIHTFFLIYTLSQLGRFWGPMRVIRFINTPGH